MQYFTKNLPSKHFKDEFNDNCENRQPAKQNCKNSLKSDSITNGGLLQSNSSYLKNFRKSNQSKVLNQKIYDSINNSGSRQPNRKPCKPSPHKYPKNNSFQDMQSNRNHNYHQMFNQTDNSMQEVLNSSINQFQKLLMQENSASLSTSNRNLQQQNQYLKGNLQKMKFILKGKLQYALKKQKQQIARMLEDYVSLITKLLHDKEQLTISLHDSQKKYEELQSKIQQQYEGKLNEALNQRDKQIQMTKNQIDEFLEVINQYEEQAKEESEKFDQMQKRIQQLQDEKKSLIKMNKSNSHSKYMNKSSSQQAIKAQALQTKVQTLLELLQKSQEQNYALRDQIKRKDLASVKDIRDQYDKKIADLESQHQQQFMQYQRAIKQTIAKKDQCIQRLTQIIQGLRSKRNTTSIN